MGVEMLRYAQHDSAILLPHHQHPLALATTDANGLFLWSMPIGTRKWVP